MGYLHCTVLCTTALPVCLPDCPPSISLGPLLGNNDFLTHTLHAHGDGTAGRQRRPCVDPGSMELMELNTCTN